ncbi:MAG: 6,7-dimethyl-8-ribityllumazine synthase [Acidimicrobiia bacterium]
MRVDPGSSDEVSAAGLRIGVVTSTFNRGITDGLRDGAIAWLEAADADEILVLDAPGAFELPVIAQKLAEVGYDAVVCLGAVVEGETDHYHHVASRTAEGLMRVQLDTGIPVAFGVLTVRHIEHAELRSKPGVHNKGREAAIAAVTTANTLRAIPSG